MSITAISAAVKASISPARMSTYEAAMAASATPDVSALELYTWNAQVAAALMVPLHVCEVVVRNAAHQVLETLYGPQWPWSTVFFTSLPVPGGGYKPREDLAWVRSQQTTTGKVIPELKFVFWEKLFTGRHDGRLWTPHLRRVFPNLSPALSVSQHRLQINKDLEQIRELRNRIAHHEPIFARNLVDDFARIERLVDARCRITAAWMMAHQQASTLIAAKPLPVPAVVIP